jgi:hypothetical protein
MLEWAKSMTWKGLHPVVELSRKVYEKGVSLSKEAMQAVEARLERNPSLPKWPSRPKRAKSCGSVFYAISMAGTTGALPLKIARSGSILRNAIPLVSPYDSCVEYTALPSQSCVEYTF